MAHDNAPGTWRAVRIAALAVIGLLAVFAEVAPTGFRTEARPSPDLLFAVVAYWAVRRPGSTPILLVFALGLCRDLLADVPVGAGALTLVLAAEFLRTQGAVLVRQSFLLEWATIAMTCLAMFSGQFLLVVLTLAQPPYLLDLLWQGLYTAAVYPPLALGLRWVLRIGWKGARQRRAEDGRGEARGAARGTAAVTARVTARAGGRA